MAPAEEVASWGRRRRKYRRARHTAGLDKPCYDDPCGTLDGKGWLLPSVWASFAKGER